MSKTRICIIRHGETDWNSERRIQGQIDIPLNEVGHEQAFTMAFNIARNLNHFNAIYSSDLTRALTTAGALSQYCRIEVRRREDLRERHYGIFQGVVKGEAAGMYPAAYDLYSKRDLNYDFENGESLLAFSQRTLQAFESIAKSHVRENVAVVCHAGLLDIMYRTAVGKTLESPRDFNIPNCALNWFHFDAEGWHLDAWDDHHYLGRVILESVE